MKKSQSEDEAHGRKPCQPERSPHAGIMIPVALGGAYEPGKRSYDAFAHDGGLDWIRASYAAAAAGHSRNLIQSCRANAPR